MFSVTVPLATLTVRIAPAPVPLWSCANTAGCAGATTTVSEGETLPFCERHGIGAIVYSPMKSGLLTGAMTKERVAAFPADDFRRNALSFQEPHLSKNLKLAELMRRIGERHGCSAGEVAIAWTLNNPAVTAAIVGMRSAKQVEGVIGAMDFRLSAEELAEIEGWRTV